MLNQNYEKELQKIEGLCNENGLEFEFIKVKFPIIAIVRPDIESRNQIVMKLGDGEVTRNGEIKFIFSDELTMQIIDDFTIEDSLLNKIKNATKRLHYAYLQMYFEKQTK